MVAFGSSIGERKATLLLPHCRRKELVSPAGSPVPHEISATQSLSCWRQGIDRVALVDWSSPAQLARDRRRQTEPHGKDRTMPPRSRREVWTSICSPCVCTSRSPPATPRARHVCDCYRLPAHRREASRCALADQEGLREAWRVPGALAPACDAERTPACPSIAEVSHRPAGCREDRRT